MPVNRAGLHTEAFLRGTADTVGPFTRHPWLLLPNGDWLLEIYSDGSTSYATSCGTPSRAAFIVAAPGTAEALTANILKRLDEHPEVTSALEAASELTREVNRNTVRWASVRQNPRHEPIVEFLDTLELALDRSEDAVEWTWERAVQQLLLHRVFPEATGSFPQSKDALHEAVFNQLDVADAFDDPHDW